MIRIRNPTVDVTEPAFVQGMEENLAYMYDVAQDRDSALRGDLLTFNSASRKKRYATVDDVTIQVN